MSEGRFELLSGTLHFSVRGRVQTLGPVEAISVHPGPHYFWNDREKSAHNMREFRPALSTDAFFEWLFDLARTAT